jgi:hypothetical protein
MRDTGFERSEIVGYLDATALVPQPRCLRLSRIVRSSPEFHDRGRESQDTPGASRAYQALFISPPLMVRIARRSSGSVVDLRNRIPPSAKSTCVPPA